LNQGRVKGTNHRAGYTHREDSKAKVAAANRAFWAANPEKAAARGALTRAENHYKWKGGISQLNQSIRQMDENRKWMDAVKARDGRCMECGASDSLESHHVRTLAELVSVLGITSRDDARAHAAELWDMNNGKTLCTPCHYAEHGRTPPRADF
jgi:5-methylcytosine-specific restriction endonuclease McrA